MLEYISDLFEPKTEFAVLRSARKDAPAISELTSICFPQGWSEAEVLKLFDQRTGDIWHVSPKSNPDKIAAYLLLRVISPEAEILSIGTHPAGRGRGIAQKLLHTAIDDLRFRHIHKLHLDVSEHNEAALQLYNKFGFVEIGRRNGYYTSNSDKISSDAISMSFEFGHSN